jgi:hypothetical protein
MVPRSISVRLCSAPAALGPCTANSDVRSEMFFISHLGIELLIQSQSLSIFGGVYHQHIGFLINTVNQQVINNAALLIRQAGVLHFAIIQF